MKKALNSILLIVLLLTVAECSAEPRSMSSVSSDHIARLESLHQQAADHLLKNDFQSALRVYSDIVLVEPDDETAYTGLGQIYMILGQTKKAYSAFESALQINPNNEVAIVGIQKIVDPDGVEGMTYTSHTAAATAPTENIAKALPALVDPGHKAWAKNAQRLNAMKAKVDPQPGESPLVSKLNGQRIQMALKNAGIYQGPIDGSMGITVQQSLRNFQKIHGLEKTGTVNIATWNALSSYLELGPR